MGTQIPLPKKGADPQFSAHVYCGQMAGWIKMPLGREVCLSPGYNVFNEEPAPHPPRKGHSSPPLFGPRLLWPRSPILATAELLILFWLKLGTHYPCPWAVRTARGHGRYFGRPCPRTLNTGSVLYRASDESLMITSYTNLGLGYLQHNKIVKSCIGLNCSTLPGASLRGRMS